MSAESWSDRVLGGFRKTSERLGENIATCKATQGHLGNRKVRLIAL